MFEKDQVIWHESKIFGCQKVRYVGSMGDGFSAVWTLTGKPRCVRVEDSTLSLEKWVTPLVTFGGSW